jgi:hypothetical protein
VCCNENKYKSNTVRGVIYLVGKGICTMSKMRYLALVICLKIEILALKVVILACIICGSPQSLQTNVDGIVVS